jgi:hypothetical protein
MTNKETLEEVCDGVLNYLIPDCKKEMSVIQYNNAMDALKSITDWQSKRMYSKKDLRTAYFSGIKTTGEGWNGEYADGNDPNVEETFEEGFQIWFEQFKK